MGEEVTSLGVSLKRLDYSEALSKLEIIMSKVYLLSKT